MKFRLGRMLVVFCSSVTSAHAQFSGSRHRTPTISVISSDVDPRLGLVDEAVFFWNKTLEDTGSGSRLGAVTRFVQPVPEEALRSPGESVLAARAIKTPNRSDPVLYIHCSPGWCMSGSVPRRRIHSSGAGGVNGLGGPWPSRALDSPAVLLACCPVPSHPLVCVVEHQPETGPALRPPRRPSMTRRSGQ